MKIFCEEKKETLNLTISARVFENNNGHVLEKIEEIQKCAVQSLPSHSRIGIYVYPRDTLHFSILNIVSFDLDVDFESARRVTEMRDWHQCFLEFVKVEILEKLELPRELDIEKFYIPDEGEIKGSLALNLKVDDSLNKKLESVKKQARQGLLKLGVPVGKLEIKAPKSYFVLNILRFFGKRDTFIENCDAFYAYIERETENFPITLKLEQPILVVSNSYLSNSNPRILP